MSSRYWESSRPARSPPRAALALQRTLSRLPCSRRAAGGTLLTGIGGDEALGSSRWARSVAVARCRASRGTRPSSRGATARRVPCGGPSSPAAPRSPSPGSGPRPRARSCGHGPRTRRQQPAGLHPPAALSRPAAPRAGPRELRAARGGCGAAVAHPLLDPRFLAALAAAGGPRGWADRSTAMRALFDGVLPSQLLLAPRKARFEGAFWGPESRALRTVVGRRGRGSRGGRPGRPQRGSGRSDEPDAHTYLLLQATWLEREKCRTRQRPVHETAIAH